MDMFIVPNGNFSVKLFIFHCTGLQANNNVQKGGDGDMPAIKPITELRDTNAISEICHKQQQPVFITKNGYGDLVVMSMEAYDELISMNRIDKSILEAEQEVADGAKLLD